jgi:hypothetical protein
MAFARLFSETQKQQAVSYYRNKHVKKVVVRSEVFLVLLKTRQVQSSAHYKKWKR